MELPANNCAAHTPRHARTRGGATLKACPAHCPPPVHRDRAPSGPTSGASPSHRECSPAALRGFRLPLPHVPSPAPHSAQSPLGQRPTRRPDTGGPNHHGAPLSSTACHWAPTLALSWYEPHTRCKGHRLHADPTRGAARPLLLAKGSLSLLTERPALRSLRAHRQGTPETGCRGVPGAGEGRGLAQRRPDDRVWGPRGLSVLIPRGNTCPGARDCTAACPRQSRCPIGTPSGASLEGSKHVCKSV